MSRKISTERLLRAGFQLTQCEDGKFWTIEREAGPEADRLASICKAILDDVDSAAVTEDIVLQCDSDFKDPALYIDGFLWMLTNMEFSYIVHRLIRQKAAAESGHTTGWRARLTGLLGKKK